MRPDHIKKAADSLMTADQRGRMVTKVCQPVIRAVMEGQRPHKQISLVSFTAEMDMATAMSRPLSIANF